MNNEKENKVKHNQRRGILGSLALSSIAFAASVFRLNPAKSFLSANAETQDNSQQNSGNDNMKPVITPNPHAIGRKSGGNI